MNLVELVVGQAIVTTDGWCVPVSVRWWAWPILLWRAFHDQYAPRWWQYPLVLAIIIGAWWKLTR